MKTAGFTDESSGALVYPSLRASCSFPQILIYLFKNSQITQQNLLKVRFLLTPQCASKKKKQAEHICSSATGEVKI